MPVCIVKLGLKMKMKQLVIADLTKRCNDTSNRLKEFSALYDVVKNERNKYVNLIQTSHQALAEMKEKIKILQNEVTLSIGLYVYICGAFFGYFTLIVQILWRKVG